MFDRLFGRGDRPAAAPVPADAPAATPVPAAPDAAPNATADTTSDVAHDAALGATRRSWLGRLAAVFGPVDIDAETWEDLELQLVAADVGAATSCRACCAAFWCAPSPSRLRPTVTRRPPRLRASSSSSA